jgi:hypothetical protein
MEYVFCKEPNLRRVWNYAFGIVLEPILLITGYPTIRLLSISGNSLMLLTIRIS